MVAAASGDESFRVTDRRRRADDEDTRATPPPAPPPDVRPTEPARPSGPAIEDPGAPVGGERSLAGLFVMLASSAALALGEAPDPATGQVHPDLEQAADLIDLLILLREKTEGNRSPDETQILDEIVYDLQLRYVAATNRSGRPRGPSRP